MDGDAFSTAASLNLSTSSGSVVRGSSASSSGRPGATTADEALMWPKAAWIMLENNSALVRRAGQGSGACLASSLKHLLFDLGVELATDYSGFGCAEETLRCIIDACVDHYDIRPDMQKHKVRLLRSGDIEDHCRRMLRPQSHTSDLVPECLFGDILDRCCEGDVKKLEGLLAAGCQAAANFRTKVARKRAIVVQGRKCFKAMAKFMLRGGRVDAESLHAHCYIHGKPCRVLPPRTEPGCRAIRVFVAGIICHHWSSMGSRCGWLGQSSKVFMQVLAELMASDYDVAIFECTPTFDYETGLGPLMVDWNLVVLPFSPTMLGLPTSRPRVYMVLTRKKSLQWISGIAEAGGHATVFEGIFGRSLSANGDIFVRAPAADVAKHIEEMALRRGFPPLRHDGRPWRCTQMLPVAMQSRVRRHVAGVAARHVCYPNVFCNLRQQPGYGPVCVTVPALLRSSTVYSFRFKRTLLPTEHFEAMGYRMYGEHRASFADALLSTQSGAQAKSLAGNGMHCAAIGAVLMFVLSATHRTMS
jgi:hypothetical protein